MMLPNNTLEPTPVGALSSAFAINPSLPRVAEFLSLGGLHV
jgi:hypothetical protein